MKSQLIKWSSLLCLTTSSWVLSAQTDNLTMTSTNRVNEVLEQVLTAYGGRDRMTNLNQVKIDFETTTFAVNQSKNPGPPWDENQQKGSTAIDLSQQQFATQNQGITQNFHNGTIINGDQSHQLNWRAQTATPIAEPNFLNTAGPFIRVTPALLVKQLMERSFASHYLGQVDLNGRPHDVLSLVMEVGPAISLYFDQETHLLHQSERFFVGFGLVGYRFHDYQTIDGIPFNRKFELFINEDKNMVRHNVNTTVNQPIDAQLQRPEGLRIVDPLQPDPLQRQTIADGVYLIGGNGTYAMFVDMGDHFIAVGGTAGLADRMRLLREVDADKPIRFGVMTHHHSDHILGAQVYAESGITVISAKAHEAVIQNAISVADAQLETVDKKRVFKGPKRELQVIDVGPTDHSSHLLVAYLPDAGLLFEADHFGLRSPNNIQPANQATQDFAAALKRLGIKAQKIVSAHSPRVSTLEELKQAVQMGQALTQQD
ncbi:MBL fold metallo-hydrolase [Marinicella meishanensis]|uniref:MBL fold metallo-hydrolase n=1 Tax=Marinicella meishanensis TaxID=2873263 RepID=UPI001CBC7D83|nr:MBL fold metallo-hydrolase [Marinicella sp. NBU2979]